MFPIQYNNLIDYPMSLNQVIDYTILKKDTDLLQIKEACETAIKYSYFGLCCYSQFIPEAKKFLFSSDVKLVTVISFPTGTNSLNDKIIETQRAIDLGADELDIVMNYSFLKSNKIQELDREISSLTELIHKNNLIVKIIIESGILTYKEIEKTCKICINNHVDYIKTSTGTIQPGAEIEKVKFLRNLLPSEIKIKASGGIKTFEQVKTFYEAGADRIGTSSKIIF